MRSLPEGENLTRDIFLKKGGYISAKSFDVSRSLNLTEITLVLLIVDLCSIGFKEGSSLESCSELPLDLLPIPRIDPSIYKPSRPFI